MSFGKNLQYLRQLSAGMTQEALAERLNVSRQYVNAISCGRKNPSIDVMERIATALDVPLSALFDGYPLDKLKL